MAKFKVGDKIRSLENAIDVSKGNVYTVISCDGEFVKFTDDAGELNGRPVDYYEFVNDEFSNELAELRAFKEAALAKYPDLVPVDPDLIEARRIVAETGDDGDWAGVWHNDVKNGIYDLTDLVKIGLAAIKRGRELEREKGSWG